MTPSKSSAGFALLYAVLLTSVVLTVGLGLSSILRKQIILSSTGAASQQAYYAANTAKECIIQWGFNGYYAADDPGTILRVFGSWVRVAGPDGELTYRYDPPDSSDNEIYCGDGVALTVPEPSANNDGSSDPNYLFRLFFFDEFEINGTCAQAVFESRPGNKSKVTATGYNLDCDNIDNPRRVERQIVDIGSL